MHHSLINPVRSHQMTVQVFKRLTLQVLLCFLRPHGSRNGFRLSECPLPDKLFLFRPDCLNVCGKHRLFVHILTLLFWFSGPGHRSGTHCIV